MTVRKLQTPNSKLQRSLKLQASTGLPRSARFWSAAVLCRFLALFLPIVFKFATPASDFTNTVQPLLSTYCYDCHGDGAKKGGIAFDELKEPADPANHDLWLRV